MKTYGVYVVPPPAIRGRFLLALAASLALLAGTRTEAATGAATGSWTNPTTYTDGSPLAASAILGSDIDCQFTPAGGTASPCTFAPTTTTGAATSFSVSVTYPSNTAGSACFRVRTRTASATGDYSPLRPDGRSCVPLSALPPSAPGGVTVTVTVTVTIAPGS